MCNNIDKFYNWAQLKSVVKQLRQDVCCLDILANPFSSVYNDANIFHLLHTSQYNIPIGKNMQNHQINSLLKVNKKSGGVTMM